MNIVLETTLQHRKIFYRILKQTPNEELLQIPVGYRNNIFWNIAHVLVTQQLLTYNRSNLPMIVPKYIIEKFRKGTVPDGRATQEEMNEISSYLFSTIELTRVDYEANVFKTYDQFTTDSKSEIRSVNDALVFNLFHEGMHLGIILSLRKAIANAP